MASTFEILVESINVETLDDLKAAVIKTQTLDKNTDTYFLKIHYTGAFFTEAEEILSVNFVSNRMIDFFTDNYKQVELSEGIATPTNRYSLEHRQKGIRIDSCSIIRILPSERDVIIEDIVKNSAI